MSKDKIPAGPDEAALEGAVRDVSGELRDASGQLQEASEELRDASGQLREASGQLRETAGHGEALPAPAAAPEMLPPEPDTGPAPGGTLPGPLSPTLPTSVPGTMPGGGAAPRTPGGRHNPLAVVGSVFQRIGTSLPQARPRLRFEMPPEADHGTPAAPGAVPPTEAVGYALPMNRPVHFGFMATVGVGLALLLFFILTQTTQLLVWIGAAIFIALGLDPVVRWLEARRVPRPAGILVTLAVLVALLVGFFATLIPTIVSQTAQIVAKVPTYVTDFINSPFAQNLNRQFGLEDRLGDELGRFLANSEALGEIFGGVLGVGTAIANSLFSVLIVLVLTLYFLASLPAMKTWAFRLAPRSRRRRVEMLSEEITKGVGNYVIGQVVVAGLNAVYAFIAMTIAGVPFSVLLAFVVALLAFIPLVGAVIAGILVSLIALTVSWQTAVLYAVLYFAYLQFEAYFLSPRVMQKAVAVPGSVAVIAVIAGGSLLGILGALMAIPLAAAVMLLLREVVIARQDRK